jgi:hypothetical protein
MDSIAERQDLTVIQIHAKMVELVEKTLYCREETMNQTGFASVRKVIQEKNAQFSILVLVMFVTMEEAVSQPTGSHDVNVCLHLRDRLVNWITCAYQVAAK